MKEEFDIDEIIQKSLPIKLFLEEKSVFSSDELTNIDNIYNNNEITEIICNDDISNCIYKIQYSDISKLTLMKIFCLDSMLEYRINQHRVTIFSEKLLPQSKIEDFYNR